jgi:hypothetical protein
MAAREPPWSIARDAGAPARPKPDEALPAARRCTADGPRMRHPERWPTNVRPRLVAQRVFWRQEANRVRISPESGREA